MSLQDAAGVLVATIVAGAIAINSVALAWAGARAINKAWRKVS